MELKDITSVVSPIFIISSFFTPFMTISATSIGCRFQSTRLMAIMTPTKVNIFCVLHNFEIILVITGLSLYLLSEIKKWVKENGSYSTIFSVFGLICLFIPTLDLLLLPIYPGLIGFLSKAVPAVGYLLYILGYVIAIINYWLINLKNSSNTTWNSPSM